MPTVENAKKMICQQAMANSDPDFEGVCIADKCMAWRWEYRPHEDTGRLVAVQFPGTEPWSCPECGGTGHGDVVLLPHNA